MKLIQQPPIKLTEARIIAEIANATLYYLLVRLDKKDCILEIQLDGQRIQHTAEELYGLGLTRRSNWLYCPKYDESTDLYVICWSPPPLKIESLKISLLPVTKPVTCMWLLVYKEAERIEPEKQTEERRGLLGLGLLR